MTERGLALADGASACPFVAFEDDRDERASAPDHRHRCYAETPPAPRAFAHQEAYCLSTAFPVCPTFQDWARREAARTRGASAQGAAAASAASAASAADDADADADADRPPDADAGDDDGGGAAGAGLAAATAGAGLAASARAGGDDEPDTVRRNPPRDWAAPPPWLASAEGSGRGGDDADPPPFLGRRAADPGQGLAGSAADRLAGGSPPPRRSDEDHGWSDGETAAAAAAGAGQASAGERAARGSGPRSQGDVEDWEGDAAEPRRPTRRPRAYDQHLGGTDGPDWERPRRSEAYPQIRSRVAMPPVPRIALMAGAVAVLAIALFFLPALLNLGGGVGGPTGSGSPGPSQAARSLQPTVPPAPTPIVYTIKKGDTLSKIATSHGLTLQELLAANPDIKNPNKVTEGQQIVIPTPSEAPPAQVGGSGSPSSAP